MGGFDTTSTILIRGARQLLTLRGPREPRRGSALEELGVIHDGSLLVHDGVVVEVGTTRRIENLALARKAIEISAVGRVVMPGFVDSHTHLLFPPPGSFPLEMTTGARVIRSLSGMRLETRLRIHLESMARHGTTTVEVKTGSGPDGPAELKILRVLASIKHRAVDVLPTFLMRLPARNGLFGEAVPRACDFFSGELLPKIRRRRLAQFADLACEDDPSRTPAFRRCLETARREGLPCKLHADGRNPAEAVALAGEYHVASIDHLEHTSADEVSRLGRGNAIATLLPCASFHSDGRYAPARALIDAGAPIALASNFNPHHTPTLNMQAAIKLACLRMGMTPAEAISAATINGAHALRCAHKVGSLEPGKLADLLILNISDFRELAHHFGMNLVQRAMKRGELIYEEGEVAPRTPKDLRPAW